MAYKVLDFTGLVTGYLTVIERVGRNPKGEILWRCECKCGNKNHIITHQALVTSKRQGEGKCIRNCGCIGRTGNDLTGKRFGRLLAVKCIPKRTKGQNTIWLCQCDCGKVKEVETRHLVKGSTKSCGCLYEENIKIQHERLKTHGLSDTRLYKVLHSMKARCYNPNSKGYPRYGGRGIIIEEPWRSQPETFVEWAISNNWKRGLHVDRIDNDGPYAPWNCRIVTCSENANNTSRCLKQEVFGEIMTITQAAKKYNLSPERVRVFTHNPRYRYSIQTAIVTIFDKEARRNIEDFLDSPTLTIVPRKAPNLFAGKNANG